MTRDEFYKELKESKDLDWIFNDQRGIYVNPNNLAMRIEKKPIDFDNDFFNEDWTSTLPDSNAYRVEFELFYNSSFLAEFQLVAVDGFRAYVPLPNYGTSLVKSLDALIAKIVNSGSSFENYMSRLNFEIQD